MLRLYSKTCPENKVLSTSSIVIKCSKSLYLFVLTYNFFFLLATILSYRPTVSSFLIISQERQSFLDDALGMPLTTSSGKRMNKWMKQQEQKCLWPGSRSTNILVLFYFFLLFACCCPTAKNEKKNPTHSLSTERDRRGAVSHHNITMRGFILVRGAGGRLGKLSFSSAGCVKSEQLFKRLKEESGVEFNELWERVP